MLLVLLITKLFKTLRTFLVSSLFFFVGAGGLSFSLKAFSTTFCSLALILGFLHKQKHLCMPKTSLKAIRKHMTGNQLLNIALNRRAALHLIQLLMSRGVMLWCTKKKRNIVTNKEICVERIVFVYV